MKILVVGASGFLGSRLFKELEKKYEVQGTYVKGGNLIPSNFIKLDITDKNNIYSVLSSFAPDLVVDCSGITDTDLCEKEKETAFSTNVMGVKALCEISHTKIIYFSSDYVFDGAKGYYSEKDYPSPVNYYGLTKLIAENIVQSSNRNNLAVRVSGLYGFSALRDKFFDKLNKTKIYGCTDLYSSPTYIDDILSAFDQLQSQTGLVHFSGPERMSRFEFLKRASAYLNRDCTVTPILSKEMNFVAERPRDTSLISTVFGSKKTDVSSALSNIRDEKNARNLQY
ncbi:SDR family oxidoreductase [Candidatus Bathycorpusculum sp.]|uniref:SDR family oxidoreductase n=1 Tax=Candidatus Bathycorpusculum sp. TaxID=2994959 RepID=UPI0028264796|nr:SDR family oxidoreductase [Candidatus Termitimicrobium sp.]